MLTPKLEEALNEQIKYEWFSAYLYMAIAGYFENDDLPGFANWMRVQAKEELAHGQIMFDFICETGGRIDLQPIEGPKTTTLRRSTPSNTASSMNISLPVGSTC